MPSTFQLMPEFQMVVDLSVKHHGDPPILIENRLTPAPHIDDRESAHAQCRRSSEHGTLIVRPPMENRLAHLAQCSQPVQTIHRSKVNKSSYSTHGMMLSSPAL